MNEHNPPRGVADSIDASTIRVPGALPVAAAANETDQTKARLEDPKGGEEGEGGKVPEAEPAFFTPSAAPCPTNSDFVAAIFVEMPSDAQPVVAAKPGDPTQGGWIPYPTSEVAIVCRDDLNTYVNCSSFHLAEDGSLAAKKDLAAAYHALVLDDVGTKVALEDLAAIRPTWKLETSPGNYQVGFRLTPPLSDLAEVERLQQAVGAAGLTDRGALGAARWVRLPNGINGKAKHARDGQPFRCLLHEWNPDVAYAPAELHAQLAPAQAPTVAPAISKAKTQKREAASLDGKVFVVKAAENPVITAFKKQGLYKREISTLKHEVSCPWLEEHTDALDTGTAYFEPDDGHPIGGFCCQHSHKDKYHIREVLDHFNLSASEARNKTIIRNVPGEIGEIVAAAQHVLAERGDLYQAGGLIVTAGQDPVSGDTVITPLSEPALTLALAAGSDWEKYDKRSNAWERCDPPTRHVGLIYKAQTHGTLPMLSGLARQPYYRELDGELVRKAGYDPVSQRLGVFDETKFPTVDATREAAEAALAKLEDLLSEFHFASPSDKAAALSAIFTAATRPSLGLAPAFHVSAPSSGSGKSYLCETISLFAGPGAPARMSYPRTSEEASKAILSVLLTSPAVIEFDDMDTDWLPHGVINRMLTSRSITDRILGVSKVATVRTDALVLGSGNNVGPIRDLVRRVLTINLNARTETPGTLVYKGNPVATLKARREDYVTAVLTIIEAWKAAGSPRAAVKSVASFGGRWADFCRQPLLWLGLPDPATVLLEQMQSDPDADTLLRLLVEWHAAYDDKPITVRRLVDDGYGSELQEALLDLPIVERGTINRSRLGHYLKRNKDRIVGGLMLQSAPSAERRAWRVVKVAKVGVEPPALPPSPPQPQPDPEIVSPEDLY